MGNGNPQSVYQLTPGAILALQQPQTAPNLPLLPALWHTSTDGFVSFHRKVNGDWCDVGSVPVAELRGEGQQWLPGLLAKLTTDAYFSVNAMYRGGTKVRPPRYRYVSAVIEGQAVQVEKPCATVERAVPRSGGLHYAYRAAEGVRWLTAAWADCDGYRAGLDAPATVAGLMRAWREGVIPVPSFLVASGQGAWAFWKLLDDRNPLQGTRRLGTVTLHPGSPVQASRLAVGLHRAVNNALAARLRHLGADGAAADVARTCRVPGSIHSTTGAHVEVLPVFVNGAMAAYTLSDMAAWLQLGDTLVSSRALKSGARLTDKQLAQRLAAFQARHRRVHDAIVALSEQRGGFSEGHRHHAVFHCALAGFRAGLDADAVRERVRHLNAQARPPLSARDVDCTLRDAFKKATKPQGGKPPTYDTLAQLLDMSPDERYAVRLVRRERTPPKPSASARRDTIRALVDAFTAAAHPVPPQADMVGLLAGRGFAVSRATVAGDYRALGLHSGHRGGRPRLPLFVQ